MTLEIEKEKEKEGEEVQPPPRAGAQGGRKPAPKSGAGKAKAEKAELAEIRQSRDFGEPLDTAVDAWLKYKAEKRQAYRPAGLKSLLSQIAKGAELYGPAAVAGAIEASMASNYAGVVWDKIGAANGARASPGAPLHRTLETKNEKNNRVLDKFFDEHAHLFPEGGGGNIGPCDAEALPEPAAD